MTDLPNRRECDRIRLMHNNVRYYATIGYGPTGKATDILIEGGQVGSELQGMARDLGIVASRALQRGDTLEGIRASLTQTDRSRHASPLGALLAKISEGEN